MDVSGSMGDLGPASRPTTKLELASDAAIAALDQFKDEDEVGLRIFTTDIGDVGRVRRTSTWCRSAPMDEGQRAELRSADRGLFPQNGTPLYQATQDAAESSATTTTRR